ncbi:putative transcription factor C2H2 family [Helianthus annuus]|nr:putative transcription factor C2H2 family [Helianthus annuus]KAJ0653529.1 putative transcription factor C2H2 family [Helianthus annuus]KAJ0832506.1 putative transcription factor C2H2 family [Helianthus annuus]
MSGNLDLNDHYLNYEIADFMANDDGLSDEDALLQQAMYESLQERPRNNNVAAQDDGINDSGHHTVSEGAPTRTRSGDFLSQFALDEAMALSLQQLGDEHELDDLYAHASSSNSSQAPVDPDNMEYEELVELSESVGVENRGISASLIAELPTSRYKSGGFFSKCKKKEKCVVCQMDFHSGEQLITLPCLHRYHSKCITDWLLLKKNCPICQNEVV